MAQDRHTNKLDAILCTTADYMSRDMAPIMLMSKGVEKEIIQHLFFEIEQAIDVAKVARTFVQESRALGMSDEQIVEQMRV